jgi:hypothetical protein
MAAGRSKSATRPTMMAGALELTITELIGKRKRRHFVTLHIHAGR